MKKLFAFTLAETLIVMGVIGVVAALTLPNLNDSTNNKEKVAKVKKIYQNLSDAVGRAYVVYDKKLTPERIVEFLKVSKSCGQNLDAGCSASSSTNYLNGGSNGGKFGDGAELDYLYILSDGTTIGINDSGTFTIDIDIDGPNKGANTWGKDLFAFCFYNIFFKLIFYYSLIFIHVIRN